MDFKQYKVIEQFFHLGELIQQNKNTLEAIKRIKNGLISLHDLNILQKELSSLGVEFYSFLILNELVDSLEDEISKYEEARSELEEMAKNFGLDFKKVIYENVMLESVVWKWQKKTTIKTTFWLLELKRRLKNNSLK